MYNINQEERVRRLLSKPFKIPVPGYQLSGRVLGLRLPGPRRPLHDPDDPNALIVYSPPELSEHERLKIDPYVYIFKYSICSNILIQSTIIYIVFNITL